MTRQSSANGWPGRPGVRCGAPTPACCSTPSDGVGELPDGSAVLDIPCGGGLALRGLREGQQVRYVAADISPDMLARARRRASALGRDDVEFAEADIERMPFGDGEFDLCLCFNGLHCLPDPAAAVREIARCLAPGGRFIGDAVVRGAARRQDLVIAAFERAGFFGTGGTADDLQRWLVDTGLESTGCRAIGGPCPLHRDARLTTAPLTSAAAAWSASAPARGCARRDRLR